MPNILHFFDGLNIQTFEDKSTIGISYIVRAITNVMIKDYAVGDERVALQRAALPFVKPCGSPGARAL